MVMGINYVMLLAQTSEMISISYYLANTTIGKDDDVLSKIQVKSTKFCKKYNTKILSVV